ncbi:hypothetical protein BDV96DRAFT_593163 [Lophiotrema nucula]|uniref:Mid2 domain-containing protein n=1 Tax=Lophiotrema nucula TaxID=690887 RepID=A0A6A5ZW97_9PLEO|nr:hypothetical protein BDV96DRAFT_593163 [Lophiotrema nucula]
MLRKRIWMPDQRFVSINRVRERFEFLLEKWVHGSNVQASILRKLFSPKNNSFQLIWKCTAPEKWCCNTGANPPYDARQGHLNTTCCSMEDEGLVFEAADPVMFTVASMAAVVVSTVQTPRIVSTTSTSFSSTTEASITDQTTAVQPTIPITSTSVESELSNQELSMTTTKIAFGLGTSFSVLLVLGLVAGMIFWRKKRLRKTRATTMDYTPHEMDSATIRRELYVQPDMKEMEATVYKHELSESTKQWI